MTSPDALRKFAMMHKALRISVSLLLSVFILLGGTGMIIGKMVCLRSGYTKYDVKTMKDCCEKEEQGAVIRDNCCAISQVSFQQGNFIPENNTSLKAPLPLIVSTAIIAPVLPGISLTASTEDFSVHDPQIPRGHSAQSFLRVFRI